jgi:hypothetical protein
VRDVEVVKAILLAVLAGCAPAAMNVGPDHPASAEAPTGRLAGPPPALRAGIADISIPEPVKQGDHSGHAAPSEPEPAPEPRPEPKTQTPRKQDKPPASKQVPAKDKPKQPPAHTGHEGHH